MPVVNVTVAYVNPPKGMSKKGSIKTDTGDYYGVWHDKLHQFAQNCQYTIEYTDETYQGKLYKTVKRIVDASSAPSAAPPPQRPGGTASPGMTKSEEMFVMGVIGRALQGTGGLPDEDTLTTWVVAARASWQRGFAWQLGPAKPAANQVNLPADLNDEIPF